MNHFATKVWEAELNLGGPWPIEAATIVPGAAPLTETGFLTPPTAQEVVRIRSDAHLLSLAAQVHREAAMYVGEIRRVAKAIDTVLALLGEGD